MAASYTATGTLAVDDSVFAAAGIYHYVVSQKTGDYEGITYSTATYDVYLYVLNNTAQDDLYVAYAVVNNATDGKVDLQFTNDYGATTDTTHDVKVTKVVAGTAGDKVNDVFTFNVSVDGATGEEYKVVYKANNADTDHTISITADVDVQEISIKHDGYIMIYGLSATDTYTIEETNGTTLGYTVQNSKSSDGTGKVTGQTTTDGESYTVTNTKDANTPTGVIMDVAPYALMVVVAVVAGVVFLGKRRED